MIFLVSGCGDLGTLPYLSSCLHLFSQPSRSDLISSSRFVGAASSFLSGQGELAHVCSSRCIFFPSIFIVVAGFYISIPLIQMYSFMVILPYILAIYYLEINVD